MIDWILILSYLVTANQVTEPQCSPGFDTGVCIYGAQPEELSDLVNKRIILNVYRGYDSRQECVDQAERFANNIDPLPPEIDLQIADGTPMQYICRVHIK